MATLRHLRHGRAVLAAATAPLRPRAGTAALLCHSHSQDCQPALAVRPQWLSVAVARPRLGAVAAHGLHTAGPASAGMPQPSDKPCPVCTYGIVIDYKNVELLSQFVSDETGQILGRPSTGMCAKQQRKLSKAIKRARQFGLMPFTFKLPQYIQEAATKTQRNVPRSQRQET